MTKFPLTLLLSPALFVSAYANEQLELVEQILRFSTQYNEEVLKILKAIPDGASWQEVADVLNGTEMKECLDMAARIMALGVEYKNGSTETRLFSYLCSVNTGE